MSTLRFFENTKAHEGKTLNDKEVIGSLKVDLNQLTADIQKLPTLTKLSLDFTGITNSIFNATKAINNIVIQNNVDYNVNHLRKTINNVKNILNKNKQFDNSIKSFLGEDYYLRFKVVCDIVNKS